MNKLLASDYETIKNCLLNRNITLNDAHLSKTVVVIVDIESVDVTVMDMVVVVVNVWVNVVLVVYGVSTKDRKVVAVRMSVSVTVSAVADTLVKVVTVYCRMGVVKVVVVTEPVVLVLCKSTVH